VAYLVLYFVRIVTFSDEKRISQKKIVYKQKMWIVGKFSFTYEVRQLNYNVIYILCINNKYQ